jgi:hypothetical protein
MKTLLSIIVAFWMIISVNAGADLGYLITNTDTIICKNIKSGLKNMNIVTTDGVKQKVDKQEVKTYYLDGKKFDRMPVYREGKPTGEIKFMELLCQRNGLKLYKNTFYCCGKWNSSLQQTGCAGDKNVLLVYKGDQLYLQMDKNNAENLAGFFHLEGLKFE